MLRALLLADGASDLPLAGHVELICEQHGYAVDVAPIANSQLPSGTGRTVAARLDAILRNDPDFTLAFIHRDAEREDYEKRASEVIEGAAEAGFPGPAVPIVPIRMTEAWLLLDEAAIRQVAGRPSSTCDLNLPNARDVESIPDPKEALREALVRASGARGRRLSSLNRRFSTHRRILLERMDPRGEVSQLSSWKTFVRDTRQALQRVG